MRPATAEEVRAWTGRLRRKAVLDVGELALVPGVPCGLDAGGFDRHTFLCGQSGSGKTYSLGVVLERLLLVDRPAHRRARPELGLRPHRLRARRHGPRDGGRLPGRDRLDRRPLGARRPASSGCGSGSGRSAPATQAALLRLDPIADADEHAELARAARAEGRTPTAEAVQAAERPGARRAATSARATSASPSSASGPASSPARRSTRCTTSRSAASSSTSARCPRAEEQALVAEAVLGELWRRREERRPVLIVIDEAHNVCPAEPEDPITALATEHAVRIAAEGRKFGLYLLVSTQRPQKVHENVITQCDNLLLMRLNSAADARFAQSVFSFVPPRLVDQAPAFRLGEALVAGKLSPQPSLLRFGARISEEGGSDVPATWAGGG